jgi:AcrR family transcriptional regulator
MRQTYSENYSNSTSDIIINCFYQLVMNKDFKKLTVSEICEEAGISRKTFYKYFQDKNDIVEHILIRDIIQPMNQLRELYSNIKLPPSMILDWQYQQFYKKRKFYEQVSAFTGQNSFYEFIMKHTTDIINERLIHFGLSEIDQDYMAYFYASSHTMLLIKWIHDGMILPPQKMASYYERWTIPVFKDYYKQEGNK